MGEISQKDSNVLYARLEELKVKMSMLEREKNQSQAIEAEQLRIQRKISAELIEKQNEVLRIERALNSESTRSSIDVEEVKRLLNENGLQATANEVLHSMSSNRSCMTSCTECTWCDTTCTSGCTDCAVCTVNELVGNIHL